MDNKKKKRKLDNDEKKRSDEIVQNDEMKREKKSKKNGLVSKDPMALKDKKDLSHRQLKKLNAMQAKMEEAKLRKINAMEKAHHYVIMWKQCRNEWKFEKLKQIWLIDNLLEIQFVSDKIFPIVLEYFKECKGRARQVVIQKAMDIIQKAEAEENEEHKAEIMNSTAYTRSRQILQTLPHSDEF